MTDIHLQEQNRVNQAHELLKQLSDVLDHDWSDDIHTLQMELSELKDCLEEKNDEIMRLNEENSNLHEIIAEKNEEIAGLNDIISELRQD